VEKLYSKILEHGYINIYSDLSAQERRQVHFKTLYKSENPGWDDSLIFLTNRFREFLKPNLTVLDAGCGNGNYIIDENRAGITHAVGIDVAKEFVQKNICLDEIKIGNLEKLPFDDSSFDIVTSLWVLEHLEKPQIVFKEIHRVLKKDGIFMFATPNAKFLPLWIMSLIKNSTINHLLNKKLFGRNQKDVFKTYYKANTVKDITKLCEGLFLAETVKLNYDPSYTSFNFLSYKLSNTANILAKKTGVSCLQSHILGVLIKA